VRLYLVRHGEAQSKAADPERRLSPQGRADAKAVAALLEPLGLRVEAVWHSPKARARQTAEILAEALDVAAATGTAGGAGRLIERDGLAPNDDVLPVADDLERRDGDLMIVGHMPFVGRLASLLAAGDEAADVAGFRTVAVCCLDRDDAGTWRIAWVVSPDTAR